LPTCCMVCSAPPAAPASRAGTVDMMITAQAGPGAPAQQRAEQRVEVAAAHIQPSQPDQAEHHQGAAQVCSENLSG
jgi:hypothetical protein